MIWNIFSFLLVVYIAWGTVLQLLALLFFKREEQKKTLFSRHEQRLFIIIPLLREQKRIPKLLGSLTKLISPYENAFLVLVTTEREILERKISNDDIDTSGLIKEYLLNKPNKNVLHFHYPNFNKVVAEQLNYSVSQLITLGYIDSKESTNFAFYNADTQLNDSALDLIFSKIDGHTVFQQSSLFTANLKELFLQKKFLVATNGIYQSVWSLKHELPRYLLTCNYFKILPEFICKRMLNYCVTHGLIIPAKLFLQIGGFPVTKQGGEDLAIGFLLRYQNINIYPFPLLENSDTPADLRSLWVQLSNWFSAILGYLDFHRLLGKSQIQFNVKRVLVLSVQGLFDAFAWFMRAWLMLSYLLLSYYTENFLHGVTIIMTGIYLPLCLFLLINSRQSSSIFPRLLATEAVAIFVYYPIITIIRSSVAIQGITYYIRSKRAKGYFKAKTE